MNRRPPEDHRSGDPETIPAALVVAATLLTFAATVMSVETQARNAFVKEAVAAPAPTAHE